MVRDNAKLAEQEAVTFLNKDQGLTVPISIEAGLRNATIKFIDTVLCKGTLAAGTFLAVQAMSQEVSSSNGPLFDRILTTGAVTAWAGVISGAVYDWLTEVLENNLSVAAYEWTLWMVQSIICKVRQVIRELPPLPQLNRATLDGYLQKWIHSFQGINWPGIEVTDADHAVAGHPEACQIV